MGIPGAWDALNRMLVAEMKVNERELEGVTSESRKIQTTYYCRSQVFQLLWLCNKNTPKLRLLILFYFL